MPIYGNCNWQRQECRELTGFGDDRESWTKSARTQAIVSIRCSIEL